RTLFWIFALCLLQLNAHSETITLKAIDSGHYAFACPDCGGFYRDIGTDYEIARDPGWPGLPDTAYEYRAFLVFDLSGISHPSVFTSATLLLQNNNQCTDATTLFFDVTTPIATLRLGNSGTVAEAIFNDLGSGQLFGAHIRKRRTAAPAPLCPFPYGKKIH